MLGGPDSPFLGGGPEYIQLDDFIREMVKGGKWDITHPVKTCPTDLNALMENIKQSPLGIRAFHDYIVGKAC